MTRVRAGWAGMVLAFIGGVSGAEPAEEKKSRVTTSANGTYTVQLIEAGPSDCRLEVQTDAGPAWSLKRCVGGPDDLYFVSNDGERVWVLFPLLKRPAKGGWWGVKAALLVDRRGEVRSVKKLGELLPRQGRDDVRLLGKHMKWLEGLMGIPGKPPRLTDAEKIEFETVGTVPKSLTFR